jgi:hypothetical protein
MFMLWTICLKDARIEQESYRRDRHFSHFGDYMEKQGFICYSLLFVHDAEALITIATHPSSSTLVHSINMASVYLVNTHHV